MPYKDVEKRRQASRAAMQKARGVNTEGVNKEGLTCETDGDVNPSDWSDRRNYSEAYLKCLDEQGGVLTEASKVAMLNYLPDPETCLSFSKRCGSSMGKEFVPNNKKKLRGVTLAV